MADLQSIWDMLQGVKPPPPNPIVPPPVPQTQNISQGFTGMLANAPGAAYEASGIPDAIKAFKGVMTEDEAKGFAYNAALGLIPMRKLPKLLGVLHATSSPTEFSHFALPPATHDLGIHATIDPDVLSGYLHPKPEFQESLKNMVQSSNAEPAGIRVKPYLADVRSAMKFPEDAVMWNQPSYVIPKLQEAMREGFAAPRGMLEDMYNISGNDATWQRDFIPMMQSRGIDSLLYPHSTGYNFGGKTPYNSIMAFDPKQMIPRYSPEGAQLAAERGVKDPMIKGGSWNEDIDVNYPQKWTVPGNVLYKSPSGMETLTKNQSRHANAVKWWEDPNPSFLKDISQGKDKYSMEQAAKTQEILDKIQNENPNANYPKSPGVPSPTNEKFKGIDIGVSKDAPNESKVAGVAQAYNNGQITKAEYIEGYTKYMGKPPILGAK